MSSLSDSNNSVVDDSRVIRRAIDSDGIRCGSVNEIANDGGVLHSVQINAKVCGVNHVADDGRIE